jgi:hypothetical protein
MATEKIKLGSEVIADFLASLPGDKAIDAQTLEAVQALLASKKLGKQQLLRALEKIREMEITQASSNNKASG